MHKFLYRTLIGITAVTAQGAQAVPIFSSQDVTLYMEGYFTAHQVNANGNTQMMDGASRLRIGTAINAYKDWTVGFNWEWGINAISSASDLLIQGDQQASAGDGRDSLYLRQGHAFAKHDLWGDIAAGKQWGVYYDVTQITDWYRVGGGLASGTYTLGTDGGIAGTGRADGAITWRKRWDMLAGEWQVGLQYMAHTADLDIMVEDLEGPDTLVVCPPGDCEYGLGHAISVTYKADVGDGLFIGAAYNRIKMDIFTDRGEVFDISNPAEPVLLRSDRVINASSNDWATTLGVSYGKGAFQEGLYAAFDVHRSQNNELAPPGSVEGTTNFFSAEGTESFISYTWGAYNCYSIYGGNNWLVSRDPGFEELLVTGNRFRLELYYLGFNYRWNERINLYFENAFDRSNEVADAAVAGYTAVGFRIDI